MSVPCPTVAAVDEIAATLDVLPPAQRSPDGDLAGEEQAEQAPRGPALSPSRAADFMTCPLLYRFRVIDKLPEPPTTATARGTLVHAALERLFDLPAAERTPEAARALVIPEWDRLAAAEPDLAALFPDEAERDAWLQSATEVLEAYFTLEDPRRLEPAERECYVETTLESGLRLRGYIDRLDVAPGGEIRIVDYKTGRAPMQAYEGSALFQMKFYALVIWRLRGQVPRLLQLMYLAEGEVLRYAPDESDLRATERKVAALWQAIERARASGDWRPRPSRLCDWCNHKALCPEFGGTPPPLPAADQVAAHAPTTGAPDAPATGGPDASAAVPVAASGAE
jgi:putative RecB family exonuclease